VSSAARAATTRTVVLGYLDALNSADPDAAAACVTDDFHNEHTSALGSSLHGRDAYRERLPGFLAEFEGLHYEVEEVIVEEDRAAVAYRMRATWLGDPAARHPIVLRGMFRFRVADGAVARRVDYWDGAEFERQVGKR